MILQRMMLWVFGMTAVGAVFGCLMAPTLVPYLPGAITTHDIGAFRSELRMMGLVGGAALGLCCGIGCASRELFRYLILNDLLGATR